MRYYGNDPLIPGTMDNCKPIEHGTARPTQTAYVPHGKRVKCLKTGLTYPSVSVAAVAAGVHYTTMYGYIKAGKGWVKVDG